MPDFVDSLIVVDDCSSDSTIATVKALAATNARVHLIEHEHNEGIDVTVVMAGDAQMDPGDLPAIIGPVARDEVDYCKGNRLFKVIPRMLMLLTRLFFTRLVHKSTSSAISTRWYCSTPPPGRRCSPSSSVSHAC